jgi:hypothetical protein
MPPRGIEQIGGRRDTASGSWIAFELRDRHVELLANARIGAGGARSKAAPAADSDGNEMPRPAASALISIFQPWPTARRRR